MLFTQIYRNIKEAERIHKLKSQEGSLMHWFTPSLSEQKTTDNENRRYYVIISWLQQEKYTLSDSDISLKKTNCVTWEETPLNDLKTPNNCFDKNWKLRLSIKWQIFLENYERKWIWIIPVWCAEFYAKDFPFIFGALVFIFGSVVVELSVELLKFLLSF